MSKLHNYGQYFCLHLLPEKVNFRYILVEETPRACSLIIDTGRNGLRCPAWEMVYFFFLLRLTDIRLLMKYLPQKVNFSSILVHL